MCVDLLSPWCPLFTPSSNAQAGLGQNRDCWVPNPSCTAAHHLAQYEFLGKLLGLSLRTRFCLNLNFSAVFWKPLVGAELTLGDLAAVDVLSTNILKAVTSLPDHTSEDQFNQEMSGMAFTVMGADHKSHPLCAGGESKILTYNNRLLYAKLLKNFLLHEFDLQMKAVRRGLEMVVPLSSLHLFTWQDLRFLVCGRGMSAQAVNLLQQMTAYNGGCRKASKHIQWFWEILKNDFTDEQRGQYLSFVWGRSRLPTSAKDFEDKHKINSRSMNTDKSRDDKFPVAHTCFFTLDLPAYTNKATMLQKLSIAIQFCGGIDGD